MTRKEAADKWGRRHKTGFSQPTKRTVETLPKESWWLTVASGPAFSEKAEQEKIRMRESPLGRTSVQVLD